MGNGTLSIPVSVLMSASLACRASLAAPAFEVLFTSTGGPSTLACRSCGGNGCWWHRGAGLCLVHSACKVRSWLCSKEGYGQWDRLLNPGLLAVLGGVLWCCYPPMCAVFQLKACRCPALPLQLPRLHVLPSGLWDLPTDSSSSAIYLFLIYWKAGLKDLCRAVLLPASGPIEVRRLQSLCTCFSCSAGALGLHLC